MRIGVDFGGVLSQETEFSSDGKATMNMPGCIEALKTLKRIGHYLVLVSFCGRNRAAANRRDIPLDDFFDEVYFVKKTKYKASVCQARALDVLIDDRLDILKTLIPPCRGILFACGWRCCDDHTASSGITTTTNWHDCLELLLSTTTTTTQTPPLPPPQPVDLKYLY